MCAAMLSLQAIIVGLSVPVLISVEGVDRSVALPLGLGLALVCVLTAGMLRRPWAYWVGHAAQVATIALGFLSTPMFFVGALFALLWISAFVLGRRIESDKARWAREAEEG
jgi:hypothetical protein